MPGSNGQHDAAIRTPAPTPRRKVFVGSPSHDGRFDANMAQGFYASSSMDHDVIVSPQGSSLLNLNCNTLWATALNLRESEGLAWFAMLHSDVVPPEWWVDGLIDEAEAHGADFLSAVVPIKDRRGLTSTALGDPGDAWEPWTRLTLKQVLHPDFPETFDAVAAVDSLAALPDALRAIVPEDAPLLANTGCFVCRLDRDWASKVWFESFDRIALRDGVRTAQVQPEDWVFSRKLAAAGARVMVTSKVKVIHRGVGSFRSSEAWGQDTDAECLGRHVESVVR